MERKSAYAALAEWFEYLNDDCGYEKWSQYLLDRISAYSPQAGLDVGCGSGYFTRFFEEQGYAMTGLDVSREMLDKAERLALLHGVRSTYLLGDISKQKLPRRFDFALAVNDCINYIPKERLGSALKNVCGALKKGGIFLFDISSPRKFARRIANTVSVDDRDEVTYLNFSRVEGDVAEMEVTLFVKEADGKYIRKDERHVQYIYRKEEIVRALEESGFQLLSVEGFLGEDEAESDRLHFLARRA